jgi:hypothetical protein
MTSQDGGDEFGVLQDHVLAGRPGFDGTPKDGEGFLAPPLKQELATAGGVESRCHHAIEGTHGPETTGSGIALLPCRDRDAGAQFEAEHRGRNPEYRRHPCDLIQDILP